MLSLVQYSFKEWSEMLSHPLVMLIVGALIGYFLVPMALGMMGKKSG